MKTTLDIPDPVFRKAKARAAERGQPLRVFVTEALRDKLAADGGKTGTATPAWMAGFGTLRPLRRETARVQRVIDDTFDVIEPEDRQ